MNITDKTTEPLLRDFEQAGAITAAKIVKTDEGYVLVIQVSWKQGELIVFNQRGQPRAWASMDRFMSYLQETMPSVKNVELVFDEGAAREILLAAHELNPSKNPLKKPPAKKKPAAKKTAKA